MDFKTVVIYTYFNPRAHEGHDHSRRCRSRKCSISIHVPTRGTTHAPAPLHVPDYFNPRAHEGHDARYLVWELEVCISIHVPTRGTTLYILNLRILADFNPRAHEGHDVFSERVMRAAGFQSTCPRGARPVSAM